MKLCLDVWTTLIECRHPLFQNNFVVTVPILFRLCKICRDMKNIIHNDQTWIVRGYTYEFINSISSLENIEKHQPRFKQLCRYLSLFQIVSLLFYKQTHTPINGAPMITIIRSRCFYIERLIYPSPQFDAYYNNGFFDVDLYASAKSIIHATNHPTSTTYIPHWTGGLKWARWIKKLEKRLCTLKLESFDIRAVQIVCTLGLYWIIGLLAYHLLIRKWIFIAT